MTGRKARGAAHERGRPRRGPGSAAAAPPLSTGSTLSSTTELEAFIPLRAEALTEWEGYELSGSLTVTWWASVASRRDECGGPVTWWTLVFADGAISAGAEPERGYLVPTVRSSRPSAPLPWRGVREPSSSVCNSGWHQYVVRGSVEERTIGLFIDGALLASAPWPAGPRTGGGDALRGLWVGGREIAISKRPAVTGGPGNEAHDERIAELALFAGAHMPAALPGATRFPQPYPPGWEAAPVHMPERPWWDGGLGWPPRRRRPSRRETGPARDDAYAPNLACGACDGRLTPGGVSEPAGKSAAAKPDGAPPPRAQGPSLLASHMSVAVASLAVLACLAAVLRRRRRGRASRRPTVRHWDPSVASWESATKSV